ncbi:hypothetical protein BDV93DRAFT_563843 [Ceratobasidium sp. AG-I]|nr:hypothetical protein BDV93DRAFT_563843 [Ceratobasidium sp. AG-I]
MPESWTEIAGAVNTFTTFFDFGARYGYSTYRLVEGKSAKEMLDRVDEILKDAQQVLENHKQLLPEGQYPSLKVKHRRLHLNLMEEKKDYRATEDKIIRNSRILSKVYGKRETHHDRVAGLLVQAEIYHTNVLSASRHAQDTMDDEGQDEDFPDLKPSPPARADFSRCSEEDQKDASEYCTTWLSVLKPPSRACSSSDLESGQSEPFSEPEASRSTSESNSNMDVQDRNFIAAVTHIPQLPTRSPEPGSDKDMVSGQTGYRRMILLEGMGKRVVIIDPNFHALDERDPYTSESSLRALSRAGENLMKNSEAKGLEGDQANTLEGPSLSTMIETFEKIKLGVV